MDLTVLQWIRDYLRDHEWPPTVREIGQGMGWTSPSTPHRYIVSLERGGYITRGNGGRQVRLTVKGRDATI